MADINPRDYAVDECGFSCLVADISGTTIDARMNPSSGMIRSLE